MGLACSGKKLIWNINVSGMQGSVHDVYVSGCAPEVCMSIAGTLMSNVSVTVRDFRMNDGKEPRRVFCSEEKWSDSMSICR